VHTVPLKAACGHFVLHLFNVERLLQHKAKSRKSISTINNAWKCGGFFKTYSILQRFNTEKQLKYKITYILYLQFYMFGYPVDYYRTATAFRFV